jgi:hypothetical protein
MISKEKKLISLMPPKTASNSIKQTLENNGVTFSIPIGKKIVPKIHLKLDEIVDLFDLDTLSNYKIFQIVRNPYHRFVSSYYHQMRTSAIRRNIKFVGYDLNQFTNHLYNSKKSDNFLEEFYGDKYNSGFVKELNDILKLQRKERGEQIPMETAAKFNTDSPANTTSPIKQSDYAPRK